MVAAAIVMGKEQVSPTVYTVGNLPPSGGTADPSGRLNQRQEQHPDRSRKEVFRMGNRTKYLAVRFSEEELSELDRQRGAMQRGPFLRNLFLRRKIPQPIPGVNLEKYVETARWASALNQLARKVNADDRIEIEELRQILKRFRRGLIDLAGEFDDSENQ